VQKIHTKRMRISDIRPDVTERSHIPGTVSRVMSAISEKQTFQSPSNEGRRIYSYQFPRNSPE